MLDIIANFSTINDGKFNDDLIYNMRKNDEMAKYIDEACKAIVQLAPEYIKYNGYRYQNIRSKMIDMNKDDGGVKTPKKKSNSYKLSVKLANGLKGEKIIFKVKNKKYIVKTKKGGVAKVNIKLNFKKGVYMIYAYYHSSKISFKLKIT